MFKKFGAVAVATLTSLSLISAPVFADAAKPGQSMTHIKTEKGIASTLESVGVFLYVQGGATSAVMGDSVAAADSQVVFHVPVTGTKTGVAHIGSNIVLFNSGNNSQVVLKNPLIDLKNAVVKANIGSASEAAAIFTIANASELKAKITNDTKSKLRTTAYEGAKLNLAPGVAALLVSALGLPNGALPEGLAFATANVSLYSAIKAKK